MEKRKIVDNYELQISDLEATNQKLKRALSNKDFHDSGLMSSDPYMNHSSLLPKVNKNVKIKKKIGLKLMWDYIDLFLKTKNFI